jgi:GNAT superfamily N-acetyltransferase
VQKSEALAVGYHALPPGHLANVVTCLEMTERPHLRAVPAGGFSLQDMGGDTARFKRLFEAVGRDIMWFSRLIMAEDKLAAIIGDAAVECYAMMDGADDIGLLELDFREAGQCELSFFGLVPGAIGKGAGRWLMNEALRRAWAKPISRLWVHTCSFDHPAALGFYQRSGFRPYEVMVEVHPDPRLTGHMPKDASPAAPLIEVQSLQT